METPKNYPRVIYRAHESRVVQNALEARAHFARGWADDPVFPEPEIMPDPLAELRARVELLEARMDEQSRKKRTP